MVQQSSSTYFLCIKMSPLVWFANFFSRRITRSSNQVIFYDQFWLKLSSTKSPVWSKFLDFKVKLVQKLFTSKVSIFISDWKQISWYWRISECSLDHVDVSRSEYSYQVCLYISNYFRFFSSKISTGRSRPGPASGLRGSFLALWLWRHLQKVLEGHLVS